MSKGVDFDCFEPTNQDLVNVTNFLTQRIRYNGCKTLGTSVIYSPKSPSSPIFYKVICSLVAIYVNPLLYLFFYLELKNYGVALNINKNAHCVVCRVLLLQEKWHYSKIFYNSPFVKHIKN